ncbi:hypothetical protein D3C78_1250600 [compost metagenome]
MLGSIPFVGIQFFFFGIDDFREIAHQILHLVGEVLGQIEDQFGSGLRPLALLQPCQQLLGGSQGA